jgi:hypothetical protein
MKARSQKQKVKSQKSKVSSWLRAFDGAFGALIRPGTGDGRAAAFLITFDFCL